jgi:uncharacterized protein YqgC (DUF456 family)
MDVFWLILGVLLMLVGLAGCILPFLPGPPLCYLALLAQQLQSEPPYTTKFLVIWACITLAIVGLDYLIPLIGTRKFGGTTYGVWGCLVGLIAGLWLGPFGLIIGPFAGAFLGELIGNAKSQHALRAALGSFLGFVVGTLLKLVVCLVMGWYFVEAF